MNGNTEVDLQPELSVVLQEEEPEEVAALPVCVRDIHGPVRTQELPRKLATSQTRTVGTTVVQLLRADHYRAKATVMSIDQNIYLAFNEASAQDTGSMSIWPKNVPFELTAATDLWVLSATSTTSVSISTERWATGD